MRASCSSSQAAAAYEVESCSNYWCMGASETSDSKIVLCSRKRPRRYLWKFKAVVQRPKSSNQVYRRNESCWAPVHRFFSTAPNAFDEIETGFPKILGLCTSRLKKVPMCVILTFDLVRDPVMFVRKRERKKTID